MKLKIGTFNLFQFVQPPYSWYIKKDKFTQEEFEQKKQWIKSKIDQMDCDIIGFQEVFSAKALEQLLKECGFEYFAVVDEAKTDAQNNNVYISTTVALASKYPISDIKSVKVHTPSLKKHNFKGHFSFSRKPVKAKVTLANNKELQFYVCHLKSNRLNEFEYIFTQKDSYEDKLKQISKALKEDFSPALKQRLCEASSLFFDIKKSKLPTILLCDLNDKEFSMSIEALGNIRYHYAQSRGKLLYDAYYLCDKKEYNPHPDSKGLQRTPTSYYQSYGNVIDYIFVSKAFNHKSKEAIGKIIDYKVYDDHLQKNQNGSLLESDHAPVVCEVNFH